MAVAGIAGAVLIATLAALGYHALSVSNTTVQPPVIADTMVEAKTTPAGQTVYDGELNQQAATSSWSDQPKNVRTFTIRPDVGIADTLAAELNTSAAARPNAHERPEVGAARTSAAAFSDPRSELSASPASRPGANGDEQKVRTSAAPPQVAARNGTACQAAAGSGGHWAWRMIDGRKCWYEGKPGMSKDHLRWIR
jgi:hypothetical protein